MRLIVPIVEGHGEVAAVPELLRRVAAWIAPNTYVEVSPPIRTNKSKFLNDQDEFNNKLQLASYKASDRGWIILLLDADDDCPVTLAQQIEARARKVVQSSNLSIVIANREYEAWFVASAKSLEGCRNLQLQGSMHIADPDRPRDAKGWLGKQMSSGYHEVTDQPAFSASMSLEDAWMGSRSFRRFCSEFARHAQNLVT